MRPTKFYYGFIENIFGLPFAISFDEDETSVYYGFHFLFFFIGLLFERVAK